MATVPRLAGPTVAPTARPSRMGALESYGLDQRPAQAIAAGLGDIGEAVARETERMDEIRSNEEEAGLLADANRLWSDPREGYGNLRGTKAIEGLDRFRDRMQQAVSAREGALKTPRQRALYQRSADRVVREMESRSLAHATREQEQSDDLSNEALALAELNAVTEFAQTEGTDLDIRATVDRRLERVAKYGDRKGWRMEVIGQARLDATSQLRTAQIASILDSGRPGAADEAALVVVEFSHQMTPQDRAKVQKVLGGAREQQGVVGEASRILTAAAGDQQKAESMLVALPLEARGAVRKMVKAEFDAADDASRQKADADYDAAGDRVENRPGRTARERVGEALWANLSTERRAAMDRRVESLAGDGVAENGSDSRVWRDFFLMEPADMAKLSRADFDAKYYSRLDPTHQDRALTLYKESQGGRAGGGGARPVAAGIWSDREMLTRMYAEVFQQDPYSDVVDVKQFAAYDYRVNQDVLARSGQLDRVLTDPEKQTIMLEVARRMTAPVAAAAGGRNAAGWRMAERVGTAAARAVGIYQGTDGTTRFQWENIAPAARDSITTEMRENGMEPTREKVERAYAARFLGDRAAYDRLVGVKVDPALFGGMTGGFGFPGGKP